MENLKKSNRKFVSPKVHTEKYLLKVDYPTTDGILKAGKDSLWLTKEAAEILIKNKII